MNKVTLHMNKIKMSDFIIRVVKTSIERSVIENELKTNPHFLSEIHHYIHKTIIPSTVTDYSEHIQSLDDEDQFSEMRQMFQQESQQLFSNLLSILVRYRQVKPSSFINVDTEKKSITFLCSKNSDIPDPFEKKPTLSQLLSILVKLVDHTSTVYTNELDMLDRRIDYIERLKKDAHEIQAKVYEKFLKALEKKVETEKNNFQNFIQTCEPLRDYFYHILQHENQNYLYYLPISILDIFLPFTTMKIDDAFLTFFLRFDEWVPSEFRSRFLPFVITNDSIRNFKPKVDLLIMDTITIYKKSIKQPELLQDLFFVVSLLSRFVKKNYLVVSNIETQTLIRFLSIGITLISKSKEVPDEATSVSLTGDILVCLLEVIHAKPNVMDSYLVYQLSNSLLEIIKDARITEKYNSKLFQLFTLVLSNKLSMIYMANTLSEELEIGMERISNYVSETELLKIKQWSTIYQQLSDVEEDLVDPLTSCVVVKPCFIPIDNVGNMTQVCDLYMLCTYLWTKPENPFTRQPLSIENVLEFNQKEDIQEKYKQTMTRLKKLILEKKNLQK